MMKKGKNHKKRKCITFVILFILFAFSLLPFSASARAESPAAPEEYFSDRDFAESAYKACRYADTYRSSDNERQAGFQNTAGISGKSFPGGTALCGIVSKGSETGIDTETGDKTETGIDNDTDADANTDADTSTAEERKDGDSEDKSKLYEDLLGNLPAIIPDDAASYLPEGLLDGVSAENASEAAGKLDGGFFLESVWNLLKELLPKAVKKTVCIIGIVICVSVFRAAKDGVADDSVSSVIDFISCICILLYAYEIISGIWSAVYTAMLAMDTFMRALLPMMTAVYACAGGMTSSAVNSGMLSLVLAIFETAASSLLYPVLRVCLGFTVVSSFTDSVDLSGVIELVKKVFISALSFIMVLLAAVMSYQSVLAKSADTLVSRTVKFAAGNVIPVIGGALSDAVGNVMCSLSLIKSAMGTVSAAVIILLLLSPVLNILLCKAGFGFASVISKSLGCGREGRLLDDLCGVLDFALALISACAVMFIFVLSAFTKMSVTG